MSTGEAGHPRRSVNGGSSGQSCSHHKHRQARTIRPAAITVAGDSR